MIRDLEWGDNQSLPSSVATPAIYLTFGVLPAVAERDVEILGLLGQLAQCPRDLQAVSDIVQDGLEKFDPTFQGFSGIARRTAALYGIQDPLELMQEPWAADRWRTYCRNATGWTNNWKNNSGWYCFGQNQGGKTIKKTTSVALVVNHFLE